MARKDDSPSIDVYALIDEHASPYSIEERLAVVMRYAACGNLKQVSREMKLSYDTLKHWKNYCDWWAPVLQECRRRKQDELDGTLTNIIDMSLAEIVDRITHGDTKYVAKTGETYKVPMTGKELAWVGSILFDKRAALRGDPTTITRPSDAGNIQQLKEEFKKFTELAHSSGMLSKPISPEAQPADDEDYEESN
jgi:hypothetical protein